MSDRPSLREAAHECQRCGSTTWTDVDYSGCSDCRANEAEQDHDLPGIRLDPLDTKGVLWVAALDRVPIEERIEWVETMMKRIEEINAARTDAE